MNNIDKKVFQYIGLLFLVTVCVILSYNLFFLHPASNTPDTDEPNLLYPVGIVWVTLVGLIGSIITNLVSEVLFRSFENWNSKIKYALLIISFVVFALLGILFSLSS